jgi:hypothetical protein
VLCTINRLNLYRRFADIPRGFAEGQTRGARRSQIAMRSDDHDGVAVGMGTGIIVAPAGELATQRPHGEVVMNDEDPGSVDAGCDVYI